MDIIAVDRETVEEGLRIDGSFVLISITDPGARRAAIPPNPLLRAVLRLSFDDAEPGGACPIGRQTLRLMQVDDARSAWRFVCRHRLSVGTLVVHCNAGISRSPAIAAAICYGIGDDAVKFFRDCDPNVYVFRLMLAAMPRHLRQQHGQRD